MDLLLLTTLENLYSDHPVFVCFTCKSRFCHKCGKKYTDDWSDKQQEMIFNVPHRHMVFTIPKELRNVFFKDLEDSEKIDKEEWCNRPAHIQLPEKLARLFSPVL